jgi:formamidopyrimidine-DNA glycosylase
MPELPDITVYVEHLQAKTQGRVLERVKLMNPFVLRTAVPPIAQAEGKRVTGVERLGKRVVLALEGELFVVVHLMIAGRLQWQPAASSPSGKSKSFGKVALAQFEFDSGTLVLTEAGTKRRASIHLLSGRDALDAMNPGGLEVMRCTLDEFAGALTRENRTLKRALTDPHTFAGIGNAYSDEILHRAKLSPLALTQKLSRDDLQALFAATKSVMSEWTERLRAQAGDWPQKVTAFHAGMAVHGKYGQPCPVCGTAVQRIQYAQNECNYCPRCQTGGRLLADRVLSRLLKDSRQRHIDDG